jgi:hypothetical protein
MKKAKILTTVKDKKGRPLIVVRLRETGASFSFIRYPDMTDVDKAMVKAVTERLSLEGVISEEGSSKEEIDDFIKFKDEGDSGNDLCG